MADEGRLQANLGDIEYPTRGDLNNQGKLTLARVVEVNNENHTADVVNLRRTYTGQWEGEEEATTCLRIENTIGYDDEREVAYGTVTPLAIGEYVIVGYLDSDKHRPVILGTVHPPHGDNNRLGNMPKSRAYGESQDEVDEHYHVNRIQEYIFNDAIGQFEKVKHTGDFTLGRKMQASDHRESAFNYDDLTIKDKENWKTIRADEDDCEYVPLKYLTVTTDRFNHDDPSATFHRLYHDAENHVTRLSKDDANSVFYQELDDDGFRIVLNRESSQRPLHKTEPVNYNHRTLRISDERFFRPRKEVLNTAPEDITGKIVEIDVEHKTGKVTIRTQNSEDEYAEIVLMPEGIARREVKNANGTSFIEMKGGEAHMHADNHLKFTADRIDLN